MVENDEENVGEEAVTFLYKLAKGRCPKSYGFNAARLAGLPADIITRARQIADELERKARNRQIIRQLTLASNEERLRIVQSLKDLEI